MTLSLYNPRTMGFRRWCALALVLAAFAPGSSPLLALTSNAKHECTDHVCKCARRCPPKRSAASDCHGPSEASADCSMRGACRHDQAAATPAAAPVYLAPEALTVELIFAAEPLGCPREAPAPVGFSRIDPHPPRAT